MFTESEILEILNCIGWKGMKQDSNEKRIIIIKKIIKDYPNNAEIQEEAEFLLNMF